MGFISRSALQERFASECIGECGCCMHNYEGLDGTGCCDLISEAPHADVVIKAAYDDLYVKYCELAQMHDDAVSGIVKILNSITL